MTLNIFSRTAALALCAFLFCLPPALAQNIEVEGHVTATASSSAAPSATTSIGAPWPAGETFNVSGPDRSQDGAVVRAAFIAELEARGYAIDIAAPLDADLSWGGDFGRSQPGARPRFTLQGEGGNRSDTNLGLNLRLGPRASEEASYLYVLNCRVVGSGGEVWQGRVEARTTEPVGGTETGKLAKLLWVQLFDAFGRDVDRQDFTATIPRL